ncbi:hypothetical protein NBRC3188_3071 [Acetobacter pasteurianus NBRC 3188]|uniref:Uncharacterized protein n=2 Tax=Acetobacteraceae TaxID=433 RepID=A0A401WYK7_ACEPA|nr:hypothetical protein NBRC3188_3071 [Acetobacter pasteurianus NBRC 3188]
MASQHHTMKTTDTPSSSERPALRLSGRRLFQCLMVLGWTERLAAERCDMHRTQFRRAIAGTSSLPPDLSAWLLDLEAAILARPSPRKRLNDPAFQEHSLSTV